MTESFDSVVFVRGENALLFGVHRAVDCFTLANAIRAPSDTTKGEVVQESIALYEAIKTIQHARRIHNSAAAIEPDSEPSEYGRDVEVSAVTLRYYADTGATIYNLFSASRSNTASQFAVVNCATGYAGAGRVSLRHVATPAGFAATYFNRDEVYPEINLLPPDHGISLCPSFMRSMLAKQFNGIYLSLFSRLSDHGELYMAYGRAERRSLVRRDLHEVANDKMDVIQELARLFGIRIVKPNISVTVGFASWPEFTGPSVDASIVVSELTSDWVDVDRLSHL